MYILKSIFRIIISMQEQFNHTTFCNLILCTEFKTKQKKS
jgi:hypothetical protein